VTPVVAIVGRPNVGKSTLFNRLTGRRLAIVHDEPGVTRDLHYADALVAGRQLTLVDTGGFDPGSDDPMGQGIARNVVTALSEADAVLCVLDATEPVAPADREAVTVLRRSGKPVVYAANKADTPRRQTEALELFELGVERLFPVSAAHGLGLAALSQALVDALGPAAPEAEETALTEATHVALVGRPNAGKSSLFNVLVGSERSLVDTRPGTTRDPVDSRVTIDGRDFVFVDTAGIRRRSKVDRGVEAISVMRALRAISRAEVVVLLCDATAGVAEQDARLVGLCCDRGRAIVVALNKVDLLSGHERKQVIEAARDALRFAPWLAILEVSAKGKTGLSRLMRQVALAAENFHRRVSTSELNRFFEQVLEHRPPPAAGRQTPRIFYVTQARAAPPQFVAMCNAAAAIPQNYRRFVINQLRSAFGFDSVPLAVYYRERSRRARGGQKPE
jgi:GTP-binding protein